MASAPTAHLLEDPKRTEEGYGSVKRASTLDDEPEAGELDSTWRNRLHFFVVVVVPPVALFFIGVGALMHFEGWGLMISSYVITQMVTTIGYGDFTVQSPSAKLFMAFYALFVLVFLAYYYNMIVGRFVQWESDALRKYFRQLEVLHDQTVHNEEAAAAKYGRLNEALAGMSLFLVSLAVGTVFFRLAEHCSCSTGPQAIEGCDASSFESCAATGGYVKGWMDSFYLSALSLTTIGFGDYQPRTDVGRLFGMVWMLVGVATTSVAIVAVSTWFFEDKKEQLYTSIELDPNIDDETFKKIDRDGNGSLSRAEYITYTLLKFGMVQEGLLDDINRQYDKLDPKNTNAVTHDMIQDAKSGRRGNQSDAPNKATSAFF